MANGINNNDNGLNGTAYVKLAVLIADFVILNALFAAFYFGYDSVIPSYFHTATSVTVLVMNVSMLFSQNFFHTIIVHRLVRIEQVAANALWLVVMQVVTMFVLLRLISDGGGMFKFMIIFGVTLYLVIFVSRLFEMGFLSMLRRQGRNTISVLLVGNDPSLVPIYRELTLDAAVGYNVKGYYADSPMKDAPEGLDYLGDMAALNKRLDELDADPLLHSDVHEIFCSLGHDQGPQVQRIKVSCDRNMMRFYYVPRAFNVRALHLTPYAFGDHIVFTCHQEPLQSLSARIVKRLFDICFSLVVCLFLIPITIIVGLIVKTQSPGPIFFKQERTGIDGKNFYCLKFRSMHVNKDSDTVQATKDDPRKFPFGDFMRKSNIDELPQFINVLMGDMSVVGPRPHMLHHTEVYGKLIDKYMVRHLCKPGITGWAQVTGFRGETQETWQMEERVKHDIWYIENWSFWLDIKIIILTLKMFFVHDEHAY